MKSYQRRYFVLLIISLCLHLLFYLLYSLLQKNDSTIKPEQSFQISLRQVPKDDTVAQVKESPKVLQQPKKPKPKPKPKPKENYIDPSLLIDNYKSGDTSSSSNQENKDQNKLDYGVKQSTEKKKQASKKSEVKDIEGVVVTNAEKAKKSIQGQGDDIELPDFYNDILDSDDEFRGTDQETNDSEGEKEEGARSDKAIVTEDSVEISPEFTSNLGNMKLLDDIDLDEAVVYDPHSKQRSTELKLVNGYFKRIMEQISENWVNPLTPRQMKQGLFLVIRLQINMDGSLEEAWSFLPSGYSALDESFLKAIRSVIKFDPTAHPFIREKYRYLNLNWSSTDREYELMPFETESPTKQEN
jgi:hypothetical protein